MSGDLIVLSYAHSCAAPGVRDPEKTIDEHYVSRRACEQIYRSLHAEMPLCLLDSGPKVTDKGPEGYAKWKLERINALRPTLAVEIHCNSGPALFRYTEVIHANVASEKSKRAAALIAEELKAGLTNEVWMKATGETRPLEIDVWQHRGARRGEWEDAPARDKRYIAPDLHPMFFLEDTLCPAVIVEGQFLTNPLHAGFLKSGGQEIYGECVAQALKRFWSEVER